MHKILIFHWKTFNVSYNEVSKWQIYLLLNAIVAKLVGPHGGLHVGKFGPSAHRLADMPPIYSTTRRHMSQTDRSPTVSSRSVSGTCMISYSPTLLLLSDSYYYSSTPTPILQLLLPTPTSRLIYLYVHYISTINLATWSTPQVDQAPRTWFQWNCRKMFDPFIMWDGSMPSNFWIACMSHPLE